MPTTTTKERISGPTKKPSTQEPASNSVRKVSFGGIAKKTETAKTVYPVLPDENGQLAVIAARIIERTAQIDALDGALSIDKAELKTLATPFYFTQASGKVDVASSVSVKSTAGEVLITFPNRYGKLESEDPLRPILGERTSQLFRQAFTLEIDGDKLPAENAQELMDELQQLFARFNATEALVVKEGIKPVPDFHTMRHTTLNAEQNLALNQICPIVAMIKTKGRAKEGA